MGAWRRGALRSADTDPVASELYSDRDPQADGADVRPGYAPVKDVLHERVAARLGWIATQFEGDYLTGERFSIADAYLFVCLNWSQWLGIDLSRWPELEALMRRVGARSRAREALETEGLALQPRTLLCPRVAA